MIENNFLSLIISSPFSSGSSVEQLLYATYNFSAH